MKNIKLKIYRYIVIQYSFVSSVRFIFIKVYVQRRLFARASNCPRFYYTNWKNVHCTLEHRGRNQKDSQDRARTHSLQLNNYIILFVVAAAAQSLLPTKHDVRTDSQIEAKTDWSLTSAHGRLTRFPSLSKKISLARKECSLRNARSRGNCRRHARLLSNPRIAEAASFTGL